MENQPSALILHHFFYPDDDVSSRYFTQFALELRKRNWQVTVFTSNRYRRYPKEKICQEVELWKELKIIRCNRPGWDQNNKYLRLLSSFWMLISWARLLRDHSPFDVIVLGSNPEFAALLFPQLKWMKRSKLLVHWCHDLYPEAIMSDGAGPVIQWLARRATSLMKWAYGGVDLMVDIGPCMRQRLDRYRHHSQKATLVPWGFVEIDHLHPPDQTTRVQLFQDAKLALLYSGTMGRAHDFTLFLELARRIYPEDQQIKIAFACRGNRYEELRAAIRPEDHNVFLGSFIPVAELEKTLLAADIHLLSLRPGFEGVVVPSKFFGSLAVGKPVIYAGPENSAIAHWIQEFRVGMVLTENNLEEVANQLLRISKNKDILKYWQNNALRAYQEHFSKKHIMDRWDYILRKAVKIGSTKDT